MKKFKLMLMFCALVSLTGLAPAEVTLVEWDYFQDTIATNTGTLSDIYVLPDVVNGIVGVDPNLILTATLPAPVLTQNETGVSIMPENAIGYAIDPNSNPWIPDPNDICGGFTLQWSGTILYTGTVNYDDGDPEVWALPLPLKFYSNNRDDPERSTQFFWDVNIFDDGGTYDFVGKFGTASKWGDGCDGSRHNGDTQDWYLPPVLPADPNEAFESHDGFMGRAANGDDMGFTFYRRELPAADGPEGTGVIFVKDLYIGGTLFVDMSELGELPCPGFAVDTGDINGDCIVNLRDFALLAATWQDCGLNYDCP